ncbi:hypothetical protein L916_13175 [Phytophthora nicotianae]|uniref:Uncharacterized protein n=1 Tax=Phytophthora nicotianae TaxID=4792 RepID=W2IM82_PHYNI|nr:hypothetical protein L916_13175 [Phytophthora nicotianae]
MQPQLQTALMVKPPLSRLPTVKPYTPLEQGPRKQMLFNERGTAVLKRKRRKTPSWRRSQQLPAW